MFTGLPFTSIALCETSWRGAARALQEEVGAFPSREFAAGSDIASHGVFSWIRLHASALRRPAAVVRHRRHVGDGNDLESQGVERAHGGLASGAGALDAHFE